MTIMAKQLIGFFIVFVLDKATIGKCTIDKTTIDKIVVSRTFLTSLDQNVAARAKPLEIVAVCFTPLPICTYSLHPELATGTHQTE